jgi:hypothetical protein
MEASEQVLENSWSLGAVLLGCQKQQLGSCETLCSAVCVIHVTWLSRTGNYACF